MNIVKVTKQNLKQYMENYDIMVCLLRPSRNKAKQLAILEMSVILSAVDGTFIANGPLGDVKGLISFFIKKDKDDELKTLLKTTGYCNKFYKLDFSLQGPNFTEEIKSINDYTWKGLKFNVIPFYEQSDEEYKEQCIENRLFAIYKSDKSVKYVKGYRGDGSESGRRGLPLEDARLMVNIANPNSIRSLLDPFAGSGGILYAARCIQSSLFLVSIDVDKTLEPGLKMYSDAHYSCDACKVDIVERPIDAIVTEIPFSPNFTSTVIKAFYHLKDVLSENGKILCMSHVDQFPQIKEALQDMNFYILMFREVNRKGTPVVISFWTKNKAYYENTKEYFDMLQFIK